MRIYVLILLLVFIDCKTIFSMGLEKKMDSIEYQYPIEIVVSASRYDRDQMELPYSVSVIERNNLNLNSTVPDLLKSTTGNWVQKTNLGGGSVFIRGLTGNQNLILFDGIRLNNSTFRYGPNQYLNTISQNSIDKIELLRGSGSVQYGSDAIGGAVYILGKNPSFTQGGSNLSASLEGSLGTSEIEKTFNLDTDLSFEKLAILLGLNYSNFGDIPAGNRSGKQIPSGYSQYGLDFKIKSMLIDNLLVNFSYNFLDQLNVPIFHKVRLENFELNEISLQSRELGYFGFEYSIDNSIIRSVTLKTGFSGSDENRSRKLDNKQTRTDEEDKICTLFAIIQANSEINESIKLSSGIELYKDKVMSSRNDINLTENSINILRGLYPDNSNYLSSALFILSTFHSERLILDFGLRYNYFSIDFYDTTLGNIQINPSALVYNTGIVYRADKGNSVYLSYNTSFRTPNLDDMGTVGIVDFRYELPSSELKPEKSINYEFGYKYSSDIIKGSACLFVSEMSDFITRVKSKVNGQDSVDGYQVYSKMNTANSIIGGTEVELKINIDKAVFLFNLAYTYGEDITYNQPMRRIPPLFGSFSLFYHFDNNFQIEVENLFAGSQRRLSSGDKTDNRINVNGTPGWYVMNLILNYKLFGLNLTLGLNNLFDVLYRYHGSGIDGLGRSAILSGSYNFSIN